MEGPGTDPLAGGLAAGDPQAFAALYDRYGERLYRAAMGMLGSGQDAEDTVQEVFVAVFQSRRSLTYVQDFAAYLFTALRRAAGRCAARRARAPALCENAVNEAVAASDHESDASSPYSDRLDRAMSALPAEQREVVALKIDGELSFAQIARVMGVSVNTAASRYRYALEKLRTSLREVR
jgi:RNA polymerase sigma-70 factor, ECF subfamily